MSNMSYCRFQNTHLDLQDCVEELEYADSDVFLDELSAAEFVAMQKMYHLCKLYIQNHDFIINN